MALPLVSIICLSYNHERFVREAIESVLHQTYPNIQIIVVDDASTDESVNEIKKIIGDRNVECLFLKENLGNCAAFNRGLALAKGEYIVDFATDDVMMPERIARQVTFFQSLDESYGVVFTDAEYIDANGKIFRNHYEYLFQQRLLDRVPQGDVYRDVLTTYFIAAPTMLVRKKVFDAIGGYDEQLAYEDFDFWVRSSRIFKYGLLNEKLTRVRRLRKSLSAAAYLQGDKQLHSTYLVCRKALDLNKTADDRIALIHRVRYELRHSVFTNNFVEAGLFCRLLNMMKGERMIDRVLYGLSVLRIPLSFWRSAYHDLRYGKSEF
jgi:glycosyltransferase involved in cell wall biosynthesis